MLCTAAAGAGAAAGAAVSSKGKGRENGESRRKAASKSRKAPAEVKEKTVKYTLKEAQGVMNAPIIVSGGSRLTLVCRDGRELKAYRLDERTAREIRCPAVVSGAEAVEGCTLFISEKGGVFVYDEEEREPVFCGLTGAEYVTAAAGKFYVFSDSLLYICGTDGEIEKTVSLGSMLVLKGNDICDAENSDGNLAAQGVSIKKACSFGNRLGAVVTEDGRSYLMHIDENEFYSFEQTYTDVIDVCAFEGFAYYLCRLTDESGYGIVKTRIRKESCETMAKYFLCGGDNLPCKIISGEYGIGVLYSDGTVKFLLPELADGRRKNTYKGELKGLNAALAQLHADDVYYTQDGCAVLSGGRLYFAVKQ